MKINAFSCADGGVERQTPGKGAPASAAPASRAFADTWKLLYTTRPHWLTPASAGRLLTGVLKVKCGTMGPFSRVFCAFIQRVAAGAFTESTVCRVSCKVRTPRVVVAP